MRIGLFLNNLDVEYQISIYKGVMTEAARVGLDLICVQGEDLHGCREKGAEDILPTRKFIGADGILILTSTIIPHSMGNSLSSLLRFINVPLLSVGSRLPGYPSIVVRNRKSMIQLMEHLIVYHGYRNLLYVGGPVEHPANMIREHVFRSTINSLKPEYPGLRGRVTNGELLQITAMMTIREYINGCPDDPPDAIVTANDYIALGVLELLRSHDDLRWRNCPVTGFDDITQARCINPALTTVWQPLEELGRLAVWTLQDLMAGKAVKDVIYAESELRIRNSCGCTGSHAPGGQGAAAGFTNGSLTNRSEYHLQNVSLLGQSLIAINSLNEMISPLRFFLNNLAVKTFYLVLYPHPLEYPGKVGGLMYYRTPAAELSMLDEPERLEMTDFFSRIIAGRLSTAEKMPLCVYYLRSGSEYLGLIAYKAEDSVLPQLCNAEIFLSNTVKRLQIHASEREQAQFLERNVALRTDALKETYRKLQEEVQLRMAVEAEVLKISEMERLRFSMDLHDDICQRLAGISMFCKSFINGVSPQSFLPELSELIDETLARTRRYAHDSFPMELNILGLKEALDSLCHTITRQITCRCIFSWDAPEKSPFTSAQDLNIFRIVQEALQNSIKYAKATEITVRIRLANAVFSIAVRDNGIGDSRLNEEIAETTDIKHFIKSGGLGLRSMRYRAHQLGAEYIFESSEENGTGVGINIPLPK